jgi:thiamine transport system permease protein
MAIGARPIRPGALALALGVAGLALAPTAALMGQGAGLAPTDLSALRFTLLQAALSALVSAGLAVPLARALARRRFPGHGLALTLMGAPFLLPVVVAVIGLLTVFGRSGWINAVLATLHLPPFSIYGLQGVVTAHVFLNLPLATRMLLTGWHAIPAERFRLAETLGLSPRGIFRHLETPMLREELPGVLVTVFLICLTSFAVALTLGGGPRATTLELAIYQAIRFDFDLGHAATLALLQFLTCSLGVALAALLARSAALGAGLGRLPRIPAPQGWRRAGDAGLIALALAFLILPLLAILLDGLPGLAGLPPQVWRAAALSTVMALASAALSTLTALTLSLAVAARARTAPALELAAMLPLAASGLVIGTGLFLVLRPFAAPETSAIPVTVVTNALAALPFGFRLLLPQARRIEADYGRLAAALGLAGTARLRRLDLPRLARPLSLTLGLAAALAMGDLGVVVLFAGEGSATLPLVIQRLMGAYRMGEAAAASLLLVTLSFTLYAVFEIWGRVRAAA